MRDKAKPYTEEERETQRSCAADIDDGREDIFLIHPRHTATRIKRYEATIAQVEAERDAVIAKVSELEAELDEKLLAEWSSTGLAR